MEDGEQERRHKSEAEAEISFGGKSAAVSGAECRTVNGRR